MQVRKREERGWAAIAAGPGQESEEEFLLFFFLKNLISYAIVKLISKSLEQIKL
jgi:hypothetical protein